jgi:hypothetical protein
MRRVSAVLLLLLTLCAPAFAAPEPPGIVLSAQQIALYAERHLLIANGGVSVHAGALQITATRADYDLRANRLTAAGDVSVKDGAGVSSGAGYVYDFTAKRGSFVEAAAVPQLPAAEAIASGSQVEIRPESAITFSNAQVRSGSTFAPQASYVYAIPPPQAKNFGYSPVPSAALEWPFMIASSQNAYLFGRARYDRYNGGPGTGLEEHYARTDRGYAALGETMDVNGGRLDLASYQQFNDHLSQTLTGTNLAGTHALRYAITSSGRRGYASLSFAQYNAGRSDDLLLSGNQHPFGGLGSVRLQTVFGHDVHPGDAKVAQDWRVTPGLRFDTATLRIDGASLSGSFDLGENIYNYGRGTLASSATAWSSIPITSRFLLNGGVTFSHDAPPSPSTYRTYTLGSTWKASEAFNLVSSLTYTHDFGQAYGVGRPMFSASFDVRVRRRNGTGVEVGALLPFGGAGDMNRQAGLNLRFFK